MKTLVSATPTQTLRNLIEDSRFGLAGYGDLHNALLEVERHLRLPLTKPSEAVRTTGVLTQQIRDLIEDSRFGHASPDELHNALLELERTLNLPLTKPEED